MAEFIFMLTHQDSTVHDVLKVYDEVRDSDLHHVGFKDIGAPYRVLRELTNRIQADGRQAYLEVVSVSATDELESIRAGTDLGVDVLMGGTRADEALQVLDGTGIRYFPFAGRVTGHPSVLEGDPAEIGESAADLVSRDGVHGIDLLAYRHRGDVARVIESVAAAIDHPLVVAGSVDSGDRIALATRLGAWGFTVGGAVFDRAFPAGGGIRDQVDWVLASARKIPASAS